MATVCRSIIHCVNEMETAKPTDMMMSMEEAAAAARNPRPAEGSLIPAKDGNAATSGLEFEVAASGDNHFDIELTD
jgi:hypothetical protein